MCISAFGAVYSLSCVDFALHETEKQFKDRYDQAVVNFIRQSFYVDDCLGSASSIEIAETLLLELKQLLKKKSFIIVK